jgi:hypothetical protein
MRADSALINVAAFLQVQRRERLRAFIVHAPARSGKTAFARKLASIEKGEYIDILNMVASDIELCREVDELDAAFLKRTALSAAARGAGLVLLDEFDFLVPVWGGDVSQLIEWVRKLQEPETGAVVGLLMRTVPALESLQLSNTKGQSRVLRLDEIRGI